MATYKGIQGSSVQKLSSDPTASEAVGQLWYNSTTGKFKVAVSGAGAWASGGALNSAKAIMGHAGTATAGLVFGGDQPTPPDRFTAETESYDGSTWTEVNNLLTGRREGGGVGTSTAALFIGGVISPYTNQLIVETWDGTSWTEETDIPVATRNGGAAGTQTAALYAGGYSTGFLATTDVWNGTTWTESNAINQPRMMMAAAGTTTAALMAGGEIPSGTPPLGYCKFTETYDGTSWTAENPLNTQRVQSGGSGNSTAFLLYTGQIGSANNTVQSESFDGTSWTEVGDLATGRNEMGYGSQGTQTSTLATGGSTPGPTYYANTEVYADPVYTAKTVTVS